MSDDRVIIKIDGDDSGYKNKLKNAETEAKKTVERIQKSADNSASVVKTLNKTALGIVTTLGAVGATAVGIGISFNSQIEQYTAGFTTMLGSAEKANETLDDLRAFAEKTPFELTDLANASTTLLAFGEDVNALMPDLKMLGDISLGNKEKFKSLALVFGQVRSQGRLMGQDLLQMINAGFNPLQVISEKTGESVASLKDKMSEGQISFEMVAEAMKIATSEGGQFYNAMESQSKTLSGQWSTLQDNVKSLAGTITEELSDTLTKSVLPKAISMVEDFKEAWEDGKIQSAIGTAVSVTVALGGALAVLNIAVIANDFIQMKKGVEGFTAATKLGTAAQKLFNAELLKNPYTWLITGLVAVTAGIITYAATHKSAAKEIVESHNEAMKAIDETTQSEIAQGDEVIRLKDKLYSLEQQINSGALSEEEATKAKKELKDVAEKLNQIIPGIIDNIYDENGAISLQEQNINDLTKAYINLVEAKAKANAYEAKMTQTESDLIEIEKEINSKYSMEEIEEYKNKSAQTKGLNLWLSSNGLSELMEAKKNLEGELQSYKTSFEAWSESVSNNILNDTKNTTDEGNKIVKNGAITKTKELKKAFDEELSLLKYKCEMGEITEAEYYASLEELNNEYWDESSEEWRKYNLEIQKHKSELREEELEEQRRFLEMGIISEEEYYKNLRNVRDEYYKEGTEKYKEYTEQLQKYSDKALKEYVDSREKYADKLKGSGELFETGTVTIVGGENERDITYKKVNVSDISAQNNTLKEYSDLMKQLKSRGEIPPALLNSIQGLSVEEGTLFAKELLKFNDVDFSKYIEDWKEKQRLSEEIASELAVDEYNVAKTKLEYVFGEVPEDLYNIGAESAVKFSEGFVNTANGETNAIMSQSFSKEISDAKEQLKNAFENVPEDFFALGEECGESFGDAFMEKINAMFIKMKDMVSGFTASMAPSLAFGGGSGTSYHYTSTYTIQAAPGESTQQQLKQINDAETLEEMRGGY